MSVRKQFEVQQAPNLRWDGCKQSIGIEFMSGKRKSPALLQGFDFLGSDLNPKEAPQGRIYMTSRKQAISIPHSVRAYCGLAIHK